MTLADLDVTKMYTYADYLKWQFEERVELIKGYIFKMSPAPNLNHQELTGSIYRKIGNFLDGKKCRVFISPFDVRLSAKGKSENTSIYTVVQPDVCVVCDPTKLDTRGCIGAPDIVVEVLSPSNNKKELRNKYELYEESGVKEYWIVFPGERVFMAYTLVDGQYFPSRHLIAGDTYSTPVLPGFTLDLTEVFSNLIED